MMVITGLSSVMAVVSVFFFNFHATDNDAWSPPIEQVRISMPPAETFASVFEPCAHCHQIGKGAKNSTGPVLTGVIDRAAGSTAYPYSSAMRSSGLIWNEATLRAFIKNPRELVPGTRMAFKGLPDEKIIHLVDFIRNIPRE